MPLLSTARVMVLNSTVSDISNGPTDKVPRIDSKVKCREDTGQSRHQGKAPSYANWKKLRLYKTSGTSWNNIKIETSINKPSGHSFFKKYYTENVRMSEADMLSDYFLNSSILSLSLLRSVLCI